MKLMPGDIFFQAPPALSEGSNFERFLSRKVEMPQEEITLESCSGENAYMPNSLHLSKNCTSTILSKYHYCKKMCQYLLQC